MAQPKNFDNYIKLHSGQNRSASWEKMVDQLSKVLAAKFLSIVGEKFDLTRVRTAAGNIKKVFQLDKLSTQELSDALENSDTAFDKSEELAQKLYNVGSDQYYELIRAGAKNSFSTIPDYWSDMKVDDAQHFSNVAGKTYSLFKGTPAADIVFDINKLFHDAFPSSEEGYEAAKAQAKGRALSSKDNISDIDFRHNDLDRSVRGLQKRLDKELDNKELYPEGSLRRTQLEHINWNLSKFAARRLNFTQKTSKGTTDLYPFFDVLSHGASYTWSPKLSEKEKEGMPRDNADYFFIPNAEQQQAKYSVKELDEAAKKMYFSEAYHAGMRGMDAFNKTYNLIASNAPDTPEKDRMVRQKLLGEVINVRNVITKAHYLDMGDKTILRIFGDNAGDMNDTLGNTTRAYGKNIEKLNNYEAYLKSGLPITGFSDYLGIKGNANSLFAIADNLDTYLSDGNRLIKDFKATAKRLKEKISRLPAENSSADELKTWKDNIRADMNDCKELLLEVQKAKLNPRKLEDANASQNDKDMFTAKAMSEMGDVQNPESKLWELINTITVDDSRLLDNLGNAAMSDIKREKNGILWQVAKDADTLAAEFRQFETGKNKKFYGPKLQEAIDQAQQVFAKGRNATADEISTALNQIWNRARNQYNAAVERNDKSALKDANKYLMPLYKWGVNADAYIRNKMEALKDRQFFTDESLEMQLAIAENRQPVLPAVQVNGAAQGPAVNVETELHRLRQKITENTEALYEEIRNTTLNPEPVNIETLEKERSEAIKARERNENIHNKLSAAFGRPEDEKLLNAIYTIVIATEDEKTKETIEKDGDRQKIVEDAVINVEEAGAEDIGKAYPEELTLIFEEWNERHPEEANKTFAAMEPVGPAWEAAKKGLYSEIGIEGRDPISIDDFFKAAMRAGWRDSAADAKTVRILYQFATLVNAGDLAEDMVRNGLKDRAAITDRLVQALEQKKAYYGGSFARDNMAELDKLYKLRNSLNPDKDPISSPMPGSIGLNDAQKFLYGDGGGEAPEYNQNEDRIMEDLNDIEEEIELNDPKSELIRNPTTSGDRIYNELKQLEIDGRFEDLVRRMMNIEEEVQSVPEDMRTDEMKEKDSGITAYFDSIVPLDIDRKLDPAKHARTAIVYQTLSKLQADIQSGIGEKKADLENRIFNGEMEGAKHLKNNREGSEKLANMIVEKAGIDMPSLKSLNYLDATYRQFITAKCTALSDGSSIEGWMNAQKEYGQKQFLLDKDGKVNSTDFERSFARGEIKGSTVPGYEIAPGRLRLDGGKYFTMQPVEEGLYISDNEEKLDSYIQEEKNARAKMEEYQEYVKHTALECANKLSQLDSMVPKFGTHQNGTEFIEMRSALEKISEMTSGDVSIADMRKAANELNKKATAYKNSHDSIFKAAPGYGADRFNMSKELINFASYFNDALNEHSKIMTENMKPSDRMAIVDEKLQKAQTEKENRAERADMAERAEAQKQNEVQNNNNGRHKIEFNDLRKSMPVKDNKVDFHERRKSVAVDKSGLKLNIENAAGPEALEPEALNNAK